MERIYPFLKQPPLLKGGCFCEAKDGGIHSENL